MPLAVVGAFVACYRDSARPSPAAAEQKGQPSRRGLLFLLDSARRELLPGYNQQLPTSRAMVFKFAYAHPSASPKAKDRIVDPSGVAWH